MKLKIERKYKSLMAPFWIRWAARIVVKWMYESGTKSYQVSGELNWFLDNEIHSEFRKKYGRDTVRVDIMADTCWVLHWIMRTCGYSVCTVDVMKWLGEKDQDKK